MTNLGILFLLSAFLLTVLGPLFYGKRSLVLCHIVILLLYTKMLSTLPHGVFEGGEQSIGIMIFLFLLNCSLLPFGILASYLGKKFKINLREKSAALKVEQGV